MNNAQTQNGYHNGYEQNGRIYKTPVGQIPKIVNQFKPLTEILMGK